MEDNAVNTLDLTVDPQRVSFENFTGMYVRARNGEAWGAYDIAQLDRASLDQWLRSRGGANEWAEAVVRQLLGHEASGVGCAGETR
jgi:hypothetical protein